MRLINWKEFAGHIERAIERAPNLDIKRRIITIRQDFSDYVRGEIKKDTGEFTARQIEDAKQLTEWRYRDA